jgi:hypothetical protein
VVIAVLVTLLTRGPDRAATCRAALIPAYVPPDELAALTHAPHRPRMVVINPASGPGPVRRRAYAEAVRVLRAAGVTVLGYVPTRWGARPAADVLRDMEDYVAWYGVDGVFADEAAADEARVGYYRRLDAVARRDGLLMVLNPGVPPARSYFDVADVIVTFEGSAAAYPAALRAMPSWLDDVPPDRVAHLVHGADRSQALRAVAGSTAGFLYATSGRMPNPWRSLPAYLEDEEEAMAACR